MRTNTIMTKVGACSLVTGALVALLAVGPAGAQADPEATIGPRAMSKPADLKTALEECKTHPSVVQAGTPFEICVESYGFVKQGDRWVQKPPTR
jgi:hypothetical protein